MRPSRPSSTARVIAAATVMASLDHRDLDLVPPRSAAWCSALLSTSVVDRILLSSARSAAGRAVWRLVERLTLPGIVRHYAVRKAFIEAVWRSARAEGFTQLLVLGAGLDTLGLRVSIEDDAVRVIELDHPATQSIKRRVIQPEAQPRFQLVEGRMDIPGWSRPLFASDAIESGRATIVVLEGVSMYLSEFEVASLLREVAGMPVSKLRLAITLFDRPDAGRVGFRPASRLVTRWLRLVGEPFRWSCADAQLDPFLRSCGFGLLRLAKPLDLQAASRTPASLPVLNGEGVAVAERLP